MGQRAQRKRLAKEQRQLEQKKQNKLELPRSEPKILKPAPTTPQTPEQRQAQANADPRAIVNHLQGKTVVTFLMEDFDCCAEKLIMEYVNLFQAENYGILMVPKQNYTDILKYLSNYVVLFRTGYKSGEPKFINELVQYLKHIKSLGIRIVYYMDDLLFFSNNKAPLSLMAVCDTVIVSNPTLREVLVNKLRIPIPVVIVPTHMSLQNFDGAPVMKDAFSNRFKVLMTSGGRIGANDIYEMCELANEDEDFAKSISWIFNCSGVAEIRSLVNKFRNLDKYYVDWVSLSAYYGLAKSVDLIIHPARPADLAYVCPEENRQDWLDSKCEVKYTLAGAARIPIISAPTRSYKEAIKEGENGFLANSPTEFITKIKMLRDDSGLCKRIGENARRDVEQRYEVSKRYPLYRDSIIGALPKSIPSFLNRFVHTKKTLFIPPIEGGPRTFYENMKNTLPQVSNFTWEVVENIEKATAAVAIAFVLGDYILNEKERRPEMKILYRLDGLPTNYQGELDPANLEVMQRIFPKADKLIWQSQHCKNMWISRNLIPGGVDPTGIVIHNGVNLGVFSADGANYGLPSSTKYNFLHLNWSTFPHKRLDLLQEIIKSYENNPDVRFYLLGNYVSTNQIANMTFWKDFPNAIYIGVMKNQTVEAKRILASLFRASTALIFTSEMEGSPNTCLEALGCGCPIIYNDAVDIVPEILGSNCLPISQMDSIFNDEMRGDMKKAMLQIAPRYSIEKCVEKYLEVL